MLSTGPCAGRVAVSRSGRLSSRAERSGSEGSTVRGSWPATRITRKIPRRFAPRDDNRVLRMTGRLVRAGRGSDAARKIGIGREALRLRVHTVAAARFLERDRVIDQAKAVSDFVGVSGQDRLDAFRYGARRDVVHVIDDVARAVVRERVVELGFRHELVRSREHLDEQRANALAGRVNRIDVDVVVAERRARADEIALVADDVDELELPEEAREWPVRFARLAARLDRDG